MSNPHALVLLMPGSRRRRKFLQEGSKDFVKFKRRFRVAPAVFMQLVMDARASGCFSEGPDVCQQLAHPLELKILGVLRVLGRASCFDCIEELNGISEETNRV